MLKFLQSKAISVDDATADSPLSTIKANQNCIFRINLMRITVRAETWPQLF
jgi:hypothetical protein